MKAADDAGIETLVKGLKGRIADLEGQLATVTAALSIICSTDSTGAYTGLKLPDGIVTEAKLDQAVKTKLTESIGNARILDGAVTSAKIADKTIQNVDLADGIVTSAKIADETIHATDIAKGAVGVDRMSTAAQYLLNGGGLIGNPEGWFMTANQTIPLSRKVSEQRSGIILVWSGFQNGANLDYYFSSFFVPKYAILRYPGRGWEFDLDPCDRFGMAKYLYISDSQIKGNAINTETHTTPGGRTYHNDHYVLRWVIGV